MNPWTPGPWTYTPPADYDSHNMDDGEVTGPDGIFIAQTSYDSQSLTKVHNEIADGRLISLAPDLIDFIDRFVNEQAPVGQSKQDIADWLFARYTEAHDLLSRARGEA